jgi:hypothetical protein
MKGKKPANQDYQLVIKQMEEDKIPNPTWSQTWLYGSWKYYLKMKEANTDNKRTEKWWAGVLKAYNKK